MKKLQRSVLALCLILAFATVPTAAASIEKINSGEYNCPSTSSPVVEIVTIPKCPECGGNLVFEGGCNTCKDCGWSKCD